MTVKYVLFDLDGTLTDPKEGITLSIEYALNKLGISVTDRKELDSFIGPPLIPELMKVYGFDEKNARLGLSYYRERFEPAGIFENKVYQGIPEMLQKLRAAGKTLIIATSKPEEFSVRILKHFGLDTYFSAVCGNTLDESRPTKREVIEYIRQRFTDITSENTIMVGDRKYDIAGAAANGIRAVGVLYGYGSAEELNNAYRLAGSVDELEQILLDL